MNANGYEDDRFLFYEEKLRWRMSRQISNANTIFYENQKDSVQQILKKYTKRIPVLVFWGNERRWTIVNGLEVVSVFDEHLHYIYLNEINKKIRPDFSHKKSLYFKCELKFILLGRDRIKIWVPEGRLYFALMNVLQMSPLKNPLSTRN
ncbi:hypothetical protein OM318_19200 [Escherichia albertii]|uniref:hypothetical protein n=1 Tax=Escherichia albertii TaxID=208962 RepID=UPI001A152F21|nr:hypothetical protein [Escherichia albertii]MCU7296488.1 hypothetical protein [Escherichia albertii]MCZ8924361.1 hypothetical protein [Escherichia albertii]MCZ9154178.1 hypothetical protein [Escherichia albertii]MCZ9163959.1 hypothetical protein [Escherichia albertii]MCZ9220782.1 hypothetical protein [Escherichia albertii]